MADVLLIEGHRLMRDALRDLLTQSGFQSVDEALDPVEAVRKALQLTPAIIILDTTWTEIKGLSLCQMLRAVAPQSKIVLLVDSSWSHDAETIHLSGANEFVVKSAVAHLLPPMLAQWETGRRRDDGGCSCGKTSSADAELRCAG
mgnify:CR=1 FL=1